MRIFTPCIAMLAMAFASVGIEAQSSPIRSEMRLSLVDSGKFDNPSSQPVLVYSKLVTMPGAEWLRLALEDSHLPRGSYVEVVSLADGYNMKLDAVALDLWTNRSAYFNGDALLLRLVAGAASKGVFFKTKKIEVGLPPLVAGPSTICGPTDDRQPSTDKRAGRLMSVGCTAWLITGTNVLISAGHCCSGGATVVQFNVPPSSSTGGTRNPPPQDQYPVDVASKKFTAGGVGNDWCVFKTKMSAGQHAGTRQGAFFKLSSSRPPVNDATRITGYGTTSPRNSRSQTQQTHVGPLRTNSGTRLCYHTDTTGGNSGSPVINSSGLAVGVHTHGGCGSSTSSCNSGTSVLRADFAAAIKAAGGGGGTPGAYTFYGAGCKGTGSGGGGQNCGSVNGNGGTLNTQTLPNEYCYGYKATKAMTVVGFSLYTKKLTGAGTMTCAFYGPTSAATPATSSTNTGTMTVGATAGWYTVKLARPVTVAAGQNFWVSQYDATNILAASLTSGSAPPLPTFWRRPPGGTTAWAVTGIIKFPAIRINCPGGGGGGAVPALSNTGVPMTGGSFKLNISQAAKGTRAFMLIGVKTAKIDLGILGAPGCFVLATATPVVALSMNIGSGGSGSLTLNIPNKKSLVQKSFYNQGVVIDAKANRLGIALTGGGKATVGSN